MDHGGPGPYGPHPGMFGPGNHLDFLNLSYRCQTARVDTDLPVASAGSDSWCHDAVY